MKDKERIIEMLKNELAGNILHLSLYLKRLIEDDQIPAYAFNELQRGLSEFNLIPEKIAEELSRIEPDEKATDEIIVTVNGLDLVKLICPNCGSQSDLYKSLNKGHCMSCGKLWDTKRDKTKTNRQ